MAHDGWVGAAVEADGDGVVVLMMVPGVSRKRRCRVSGVVVA